ncbi:MAG: nucleoside-diphosphate sugar epimerase/dehydratase [Bacteroidota bacterium]
MQFFSKIDKNNFPRWIIILGDFFISIFSLGIAYLIRFDLKADKTLIKTEWDILSKSILIYIFVKLLIFYIFKIHKGLIRHTSMEDIRRIFLANLSASILFLILGFVRNSYFDGYYLFPSSVLIMEFFVSFFVLLSFRFSIKFIYTESNKEKTVEKENIFIYGAGVSGLITKRTIEKDQRISYNILGFIDDNLKLKGSRLEGVTIYHSSQLEKLIADFNSDKYKVAKLIVAIQKPDEKNRKKIVEICFDNNIDVQQIPSTKSWINGEFSTKQIGKIKIEDLLGRNPIRLNADKIKQELENEIVLVTGAAGSIGSGLVKEIATYNPKLLILLDQAESPLYDLEHELKSNFTSLNYEIVIGDIRAKERMKRLFEAYNPKYVFHAAAYKHVPLMEDNPSEAINTNVKGTMNLVDLAVEFEIEKFVMISTDKAVNPTNVMGASKRIAEMYAQHKNASNSKTKIITTRFGNVLGSNGSVIPLFKKQIEQGGPITLTDEKITRFFMTIPEACQLVLEAANMGNGGEIFVFDMGESVKIIDLAKKMILLSGLELGKDIEIKITGLRPGEKLYEELLSDEENTIPTHHPQILIAKMRESNADITENIKELIALFESQNNHKIVSKMKEIVPEYISNNSEFSILDK